MLKKIKKMIKNYLYKKNTNIPGLDEDFYNYEFFLIDLESDENV